MGTFRIHSKDGVTFNVDRDTASYFGTIKTMIDSLLDTDNGYMEIPFNAGTINRVIEWARHYREVHRNEAESNRNEAESIRNSPNQNTDDSMSTPNVDDPMSSSNLDDPMSNPSLDDPIPNPILDDPILNPSYDSSDEPHPHAQDPIPNLNELLSISPELMPFVRDSDSDASGIDSELSDEMYMRYMRREQLRALANVTSPEARKDLMEKVKQKAKEKARRKAKERAEERARERAREQAQERPKVEFIDAFLGFISDPDDEDASLRDADELEEDDVAWVDQLELDPNNQNVPEPVPLADNANAPEPVRLENAGNVAQPLQLRYVPQPMFMTLGPTAPPRPDANVNMEFNAHSPTNTEFSELTLDSDLSRRGRNIPYEYRHAFVPFPYNVVVFRRQRMFELDRLQNLQNANRIATVSDPNAPVPDPNAPAPDPNAPVPDPNAPAPDPNAPVPDPNAPVPDPNAPIPDPDEAVSDPNAPDPDQYAPAPDPNAPALDLNAPAPDPNASVSDPNASVSNPSASVLDPNALVPDPSTPVPDPNAAVLDPNAPVLDPNAPVSDPNAVERMQLDEIEPRNLPYLDELENRDSPNQDNSSSSPSVADQIDIDKLQLGDSESSSSSSSNRIAVDQIGLIYEFSITESLDIPSTYSDSPILNSDSSNLKTDSTSQATDNVSLETDTASISNDTAPSTPDVDVINENLPDQNIVERGLYLRDILEMEEQPAPVEILLSPNSIYPFNPFDFLPEKVIPAEKENCDSIKYWDTQFLNVGHDDLFEIIMAAHYLDIPDLITATILYIGNILKKNTREDLIKIFHILNPKEAKPIWQPKPHPEPIIISNLELGETLRWAPHHVVDAEGNRRARKRTREEMEMDMDIDEED